MSILGLLTPFLLLAVFYYLKDIPVEAKLFSNVEKWIDINLDFLDIPLQVVYIVSALSQTGL